MTDSHSPQTSAEPLEYRALYKYLDNRFADAVVLTFAQIESLLGFALPDFARLRHEWWASVDEDGSPSTQSSSWTRASRIATPNLLAQSVLFERQADMSAQRARA
jgi:hypothetical protein